MFWDVAAQILLILTGTLPAAWGAEGAFPALDCLGLFADHLNGTLPAAWGSNMSFPSLRSLQLGPTRLTGSLPLE